ncbi:MAG: hypothetical protein KAI79_13945 [Bacteroidales bacterium]|nr:hypothetical protein [Bacteroidales bacterium]
MAEFRKQKQMHHAIDYFKTHIDKHYKKQQIADEKELLADLLFCLRKTNKTKAGLEYYFNILKQNIPKYIKLKHELVWGLLEMIKKELYYEFRKESIAMAQVLSFQQDKLAFSLFVFKLTEAEMATHPPDLIALLNIFHKMIPEKLSTENYSFQAKSKTVKLPSDIEKYYLSYSKLLYQAKKYDECIENSKQAQNHSNIVRPTYLFWLKRLEALSYNRLDNSEQAISILEAEVQQNPQWFIYYEMYKIAISNKQHSEIYLALSFLLPGVIDYKIKIFENVAENSLLPKEISQTALKIASEIRARNNWKNSKPASLSDMELVGLHNTYLNNWINYLHISKQVFLGKISRMLHKGNNGDGFIRHKNKSYYFKVRNVLNADRKTEIIEQINCYFIPQTSIYNGKKRESALWIILLSNKTLIWPKYNYKLK